MGHFGASSLEALTVGAGGPHAELQVHLFVLYINLNGKNLIIDCRKQKKIINASMNS